MLVKRILAVILGLALAFLLLELGVRGIESIDSATATAVSRRVRQNGPSVSTWSTGTTPEARILIVGDSFTWGFGVAADDVYAACLARTLHHRGHDVEVTTYSLPGWNTRLAANALRKDFASFDADLLIVGHVLNDAEKLRSKAAMANRPELFPWHPQGRVETWLESRSRLFSRTRKAIDTIHRRPMLQAYYRELYQDAEGRDLWRRSLHRLYRLAEKRGIPAVLAVFPIFDSHLGDDYPYSALHALVRKTGEGIGFQVLDLLPGYDGIDGRDLAVAPFEDPHPNALAHRVAGRALADYLEERGLLARIEGR